ncbi:hypothetical protein, partial [Streptomyces europaeiscabiei]|uniref:hypothetical protein n=1 Tax=Streptomyces europaeiscabiei TaxID=146819 RepID=UPI0006285D68
MDLVSAFRLGELVRRRRRVRVRWGLVAQFPAPLKSRGSRKAVRLQTRKAVRLQTRKAVRLQARRAVRFQARRGLVFRGAGNCATSPHRTRTRRRRRTNS